jgi:putative sterol carrier protein
MSEQARAFFDQLGDRAVDPRLGRVRGSLRFDLTDRDGIDSWRVVLDRGAAAVEHDGGDADCTVRVDAASFDAMVEGRLNPTVAMLQGLIHVDGGIDLLWYFQKLFPPTPADAARTAR